MADSNRGPEVFELNQSQMIGTMFPFVKLFPESALLLTNFIHTHLSVSYWVWWSELLTVSVAS